MVMSVVTNLMVSRGIVYGVKRRQLCKEGHMKTKLVTSFGLLVLGLLAGGGPIFAPHGSAAHANTKLVELKNATVTKVNWGNPHTLVLFDVKDDKGNVVHWVVEGGAASALTTSGWTKNAIQPGAKITVYWHQVKNEEPIRR